MSRKDEMNSFGPIPKWTIVEDLIGFKSLINCYPPYVGAGIQVDSVDPDFHWIEVKMDLTFWNENYVGVHFGGSLYAMCDPFYMFILMRLLGPDYMVWDKAAKIDFLKPGTGEVRARFEVSPTRLQDIKDIVAKERKTNQIFDCYVLDEKGQKVAKIEKTLYIRKLSK